jgi:serine/threonine protein kinase
LRRLRYGEVITMESMTMMEAFNSDLLNDQSQKNCLIASRYELGEELGRGGSSIVYAAYDQVLARQVAIKLLRTGRLSDKAILRFQQEARFIAKLNHKSIVRLLDFGLSDDAIPFMVLELVNGLSIAQCLNDRFMLNPSELLTLLIDATDALAHAHKVGVIHRDIKPANILVVNEGSNSSAKIIDFSVSKLMTSIQELPRLTTTNHVVGSPCYMSPEQVRNAELDATSDIYSLGCVIYEMICGKPPFQADTAVEIFVKHTLITPTSIKQDVADYGLPESIHELIMRCLEKKSEDRYQSMEELKSALENALSELNRSSQSALENALSESHRSRQPAESDSQLFEQRNNKFFPRTFASGFALLAVYCLFLSVLFSFQANRPIEDYFSSYSVKEKSKSSVRDIEGSYKHHFDRNKTSILLAHSFFLRDEDMKAILKMPLLKDINVRETGITDLTLSYTVPLKLKRLNVSETMISDTGLKNLAEQRELEQLDIGRNSITSRGLKNLVGLNSLVDLNVRKTEVDDSCGAYLIRLKLNRLNLDGTKVTDLVLSDIAKIETLQHLSMKKCSGITSSGIQSFRRARPGCILEI